MGKPAAWSEEKVTRILHGSTELVLGIQEQSWVAGGRV